MKTPLRLLMVEDSKDDVELIIHALVKGGFKPAYQHVDSMAGLDAALATGPWDIVICDHHLNGFDSLAVLEVFNSRSLVIPFIIVSGHIGEEMAVEAIKAGANDYVLKSHLSRLVPTVMRELRDAENRRAKLVAEEALRRSEQDLNDFFEHACMPLNWLGPDGTILRVNQAELEMLGYEHDEYAGRPINKFFVDGKLALTFLKRLHAGEPVVNFEARLRCKNGDIKYVLINSNVLREDGRFIHSRSFTRDITDRKVAETARAYLASIVESSDDAIIGVTLDGIILSWNEGATKMYGYSAPEMMGRSISLLTPEYRPESWPDLYGRLQHGESVHCLETVRKRKDGSVVEVALTLSAIKDLDGELIGISAIESDISARKEEEAERMELIRELTEELAKVRNIETMPAAIPVGKKSKSKMATQ